jgi:predicted O-methyltransferase YrrM
MKKVDQKCEKEINVFKNNFMDFIDLRSEFISRLYQSCYEFDKELYMVNAIYPAIHMINLMGYENGVEIGVSGGNSTITLLDLCNNLKTLYCIDNYKPYRDYYTSNFYVDKYETEIIKNLFLKKLNSNPHKNKVIFYEEDSDNCLNKFENSQLDFVFLDAHLDSEHIRNDLKKWYPKVRSGGLLLIHDTQYSTVEDEILEFIKRVDVDVKYSNVLNLCCLLKK